MKHLDCPALFSWGGGGGGSPKAAARKRQAPSEKKPPRPGQSLKEADFLHAASPAAQPHLSVQNTRSGGQTSTCNKTKCRAAGGELVPVDDMSKTSATVTSFSGALKKRSAAGAHRVFNVIVKPSSRTRHVDCKTQTGLTMSEAFPAPQLVLLRQTLPHILRPAVTRRGVAVITTRKMDFTIMTNWELFQSSFNNLSSC